MALYLAVVQIALPLAMIIWLSVGRPARRADLVARIAAGWVLLCGIAVAGVWLAVPLSTVAILAALMLLADIVASMRFTAVRASTSTFALWGGRIVVLAAAAFGLWASAPAVTGWPAPADRVDLSFPFGEERYHL